MSKIIELLQFADGRVEINCSLSMVSLSSQILTWVADELKFLNLNPGGKPYLL